MGGLRQFSVLAVRSFLLQIEKCPGNDYSSQGRLTKI